MYSGYIQLDHYLFTVSVRVGRRSLDDRHVNIYKSAVCISDMEKTCPADFAMPTSTVVDHLISRL